MAIYLLQTYSSKSKSCSCCCSSCEDLGYVTNCTPNQGSAGVNGGEVNPADGNYYSVQTDQYILSGPRFPNSECAQTGGTENSNYTETITYINNGNSSYISTDVWEGSSSYDYTVGSNPCTEGYYTHYTCNGTVTSAGDWISTSTEEEFIAGYSQGVNTSTFSDPCAGDIAPITTYSSNKPTGDGYSSSSTVVTCQPISVPCPQNPDNQLNCYKQTITPLVPPSPPSSPTPSDLDPSCAQCQGSIDGVNLAPFTFFSSPGAIQACINASNLPNPFVEGNITFHCNGLCFTCS